MLNLIEYLMELELTQNDASVYLQILKRGASNPSEISKATKIRRARVYDSLKRLIERGFVIQDIEKKRPMYICSKPQLLLQELEDKISRKKEALDIIQSELMDTAVSKMPKGVFFYNTDAASRQRIRELIEDSQQKITIMAVIPSSLRDEALFPSTLLTQKSLSGQEIRLILNVQEKNWELCVNLFSKKVQIYHYPFVKKLQTVFHQIDDNALCISPIKRHNGRVELQHSIHFYGKQELMIAFDFLLQGYINQSKSLKDRLDELKPVIHSTNSLKSIFGINE
jgi:predicted transcriptional regulator